MAQRLFEIDELARLVSCHLVSVSRSAVVSLARTHKMPEVPALSSLWDLHDSLSVLSNVLPATDEVRNPYLILNSPYHFDRKQSVATSEKPAVQVPEVRELDALAVFESRRPGLSYRRCD